LDILIRKFGDIPANNFGANGLSAVQEEMVSQNWCLNNCNRNLSRIKHVFNYGVRKGLITKTETYVTLSTVKGLKTDEFGVRSTDKVRPVPVNHIEQILPFVSPQIPAMLDLCTGGGERVVGRQD
jgi:hypothetical protein